MKKIILFILLLVPMLSQAYDTEIDGIYYDFSGDNATVTYKKRSELNGNAYSESILIPSTVTYHGKTYTVGCIGDYAFYYCSNLTSITIPNSVTSIRKEAFAYCSSLTSITIPNSVTSIGSWAFEDCSGLTSITIPNSVTSIGDYAFYGCSGLTSVNISDLSSWCKINFSNSRGNPLFSAHRLYLNGEEIKDLVIPNDISSIAPYAFYGCSGLTSITIPNSVTSIGEGAFEGCSGLTSITIPNSVTSIGDYIFSDCPDLASIVVESNNPKYDSRENSNAIIETSSNKLITGCKNTVIPNSVTSIGKGAFEGCSGLTSITIPNSVTSIGSSAFSGCSGLTSITIPNSVTSIGYEAFCGCSGLTSITIPNSVTSIGEGAFEGCSGLTSITIPNSVTSIGEGAFEGCSGLTSVTIPNSVESIGSSAFEGCSGLTSITIPNSVTSIGDYIFSDCPDLASIVVESNNPKYDSRENSNAIIETSSNSLIAGCKNTVIPNSVTNIGDYAFYHCSGLTSITIPNSVTSIGYWAFNGCYGLKSIVVAYGNSQYDSRGNCNAIIETSSNTLIVGCQNTIIPTSVASIGSKAFMYCYGLTSITIPNSVTSIDGGAFSACTGLTSITIPNSVTDIWPPAFYGCSGLSSIVVEAGNPKYDSRENCNAIIDTSSSSLIAGCKNTIIPNSVTSIEDYAFTCCSGLTSITIPNSVTSIEDYAFTYCSGLTSITIPNSVTSIGYKAFDGCYMKKDDFVNNSPCKSSDMWGLTFVDTEQEDGLLIKDNTVISCGHSVTSVTIPNSVTRIGSQAFLGCSNLTSVTIPNSVTNIDMGAFYGCSGLKSIYCYAEKAPTTGWGALFSVYNDAILYVPAESIDSYKTASCWKLFRNILPIITDTDITSKKNAIYVNETEGYAGESIVLSVKMKNSVEVSGLQCNVYLPEEIEVEKVARGQRLKVRNDDDEYIFSFENSVYDDGSRFILAYTSKDAVVEGNDGEIATITFKIPKTMKPGNYPIMIKNIELSKDGNGTTIDNVYSTLKILEYSRGDANGDGKLSVSDITSIASHLLGRTPDNFILKAADANGDEKISVSDITAISRMLLNGYNNNARVRTLFTEKVE